MTSRVAAFPTGTGTRAGPASRSDGLRRPPWNTLKSALPVRRRRGIAPGDRTAAELSIVDLGVSVPVARADQGLRGVGALTVAVLARALDQEAVGDGELAAVRGADDLAFEDDPGAVGDVDQRDALLVRGDPLQDLLAPQVIDPPFGGEEVLTVVDRAAGPQPPGLVRLRAAEGQVVLPAGGGAGAAEREGSEQKDDEAQGPGLGAHEGPPCSGARRAPGWDCEVPARSICRRDGWKDCNAEDPRLPNPLSRPRQDLGGTSPVSKRVAPILGPARLAWFRSRHLFWWERGPRGPFRTRKE